jgi:DNA-binding response OmpR family regulator
MNRILIVDDSSTSLLLAKMLLSQEPIEILTAKDGVEAVEQALSQSPDLILLDVVMPRMDGFEVCRELRAKDQTCNTPILMVTTRGEALHVEEGYRAGCTDYICKPFDPSELLTKVKSYLAG